MAEFRRQLVKLFCDFRCDLVNNYTFLRLAILGTNLMCIITGVEQTVQNLIVTHLKFVVTRMKRSFSRKYKMGATHFLLMIG